MPKYTKYLKTHRKKNPVFIGWNAVTTVPLISFTEVRKQTYTNSQRESPELTPHQRYTDGIKAYEDTQHHIVSAKKDQNPQHRQQSKNFHPHLVRTHKDTDTV